MGNLCGPPGVGVGSSPVPGGHPDAVRAITRTDMALNAELRDIPSERISRSGQHKARSGRRARLVPTHGDVCRHAALPPDLSFKGDWIAGASGACAHGRGVECGPTPVRRPAGAVSIYVLPLGRNSGPRVRAWCRFVRVKTRMNRVDAVGLGGTRVGKHAAADESDVTVVAISISWFSDCRADRRSRWQSAGCGTVPLHSAASSSSSSPLWASS